MEKSIFGYFHPEYTCRVVSCFWLDEYTSNHKLQNMDGTIKWYVYKKASVFEYMSVKPDVLPNIVENESICIWSIPNHTDDQPTLMSTITDRRTWDLGQHKGVVSTNGNISDCL